ncbi:MAG: hypothetical protein AABZ15_02705 [Nitrospirota bacterium]
MLLARAVLLVIAILVVSACGAQMVQAPGSGTSSQYAPINEASRSGVMKYLNEGADSVIARRRENAYQQMHSACNGKYRIDSEGPRAEGGAIVPMGSGSMYFDSQYWYIKFSCVQ